MYKKTKISLLVATTLSISACGGGDGSENPTPVQTTPTPVPVQTTPTPVPTPSSTLGVTVIDGYLSGAMVWLEKKESSNFILENDEVSALTDENGVAQLDISNIDNIDDYLIVSKSIAGVTVDQDHGKTISKDLLMTAYKGGVVTPLTTLVEAKMRLNPSNSPEVAYQQALQEVATDLGIASDDVQSVVQDYKVANSAGADKAEQSALSLVISGVIPENSTQLNSASELEKSAQAVNILVQNTPVNQIVMSDELGVLVVVENDDNDNDGIINALDVFPDNSEEWYDTDGDGKGNNEDLDDDGDGVEDVKDAFPVNANESLDSDYDNIGNNADLDDDNDGVSDLLDAFPLDFAETQDSDNDGIGNHTDLDDDNDGVDDFNDAFPLNANETLDTDGDGLGNNADLDDDGDSVADNKDAFPLNHLESIDTDNDGLGNNTDLDDDADTIVDTDDAFPLNTSEAKDTDGDGIGNNEDTDDDNDNYADDVDNNPLQALEIPVDYVQCMDSLPAYPKGVDVDGRSNATLYQISRINLGQTEPVTYSQLHEYVTTQKGLPNGIHLEKDIIVNQITADFGGTPDKWSPNLEFEYVNADTNEYYGFQDGFYRWWAFNVYNVTPLKRLNEETLTEIARTSKWSPDTAISYDGLSSTYLGKEIIDTIIGLREVCVVEHIARMELIDQNNNPDVQDALYDEKIKTYIDTDNIAMRTERNVLEYKMDNLVTPYWGYTDLVQTLSGLILNGKLLGEDPISSRVPQDQPLTFDQCLAELPSGIERPTVGDELVFEMERSKSDGTVQRGDYTWKLFVADNINWQTETGLVESGLNGSLYDEEGTFLVRFVERYFNTKENQWVGLEATEGDSTEIKWGAYTTETTRASLVGRYRIPEVNYGKFDVIDTDTQYGNWLDGKSTNSTVYVGKELIEYSTENQKFSQLACKVYRYSEEDSVNLAGETAIAERRSQMEWLDNNGLVYREQTNQIWQSEIWKRTAVNTQ